MPNHSRIEDRTEPGTDLHDVVTGTDSREFSDAANGVRVGHEVLAKVASRSEAVVVEEFANRGAGVSH